MFDPVFMLASVGIMFAVVFVPSFLIVKKVAPVGARTTALAATAAGWFGFVVSANQLQFAPLFFREIPWVRFGIAVAAGISLAALAGFICASWRNNLQTNSFRK